MVPTAETNINAAYEDDICVVYEAAEGGNGGRVNCPGGLLLQLPDNVCSVSPLFSLLLIIIFFWYRVDGPFGCELLIAPPCS